MKPDYKELWSELSREFVLLEAENAKLRDALINISNNYANRIISKDGLAWLAKEALAAADAFRDETE